jgi:hypothetical protein
VLRGAGIEGVRRNGEIVPNKLTKTYLTKLPIYCMIEKEESKMEIEILDNGDEVIGFSDNKLAIKKKNGEVEIFIIEIDNNIPRINPESLLINFKTGKTKRIVQKKGKSEIISF